MIEKRLFYCGAIWIVDIVGTQILFTIWYSNPPVATLSVGLGVWVVNGSAALVSTQLPLPCPAQGCYAHFNTERHPRANDATIKRPVVLIQDGINFDIKFVL